MGYQRISYTVWTETKDNIDSIYDKLKSRMIFSSRGHLFYSLIKYMEPMVCNRKIWQDISTCELDKTEKCVITLSVPEKKSVRRLYHIVKHAGYFKHKSEFIGKLFKYFSQQSNIQFWGHVASWYLGRNDNEFESKPHLKTQTKKI